jgi:hypothetical protein
MVCGCGIFGRAWRGFVRLRQSPLSSLFVVCVAIFTDMLVYGMVVPIFVPEILHITTIEVSTVESTTALFPSLFPISAGAQLAHFLPVIHHFFKVGVLFAMYAAGLLIATPIFGILTDK